MKENCYNHPEKDSVSLCHSCRRHFCADCLVVGGDYYFCRDNDCQSAIQNELNGKKDIEQDSIINRQIDKVVDLFSSLMEKGVSPSLYFVIFGNGLAFVVLSILITKHIIDIALGLRSVVVDVSFSQNEILLIITVILLFVMGIFMAIKSIKSYNAAKSDNQENEETKINYGLGWICTFSGIAGLVIMVVMFIRKKIAVALQALSLIIIGIIASKIIDFANPSLFLESSRTIYQFINPNSVFGVIEIRQLLTTFLYFQLHYFIVPILLIVVVRYIGTIIQNRKKALET